MNLPIAHGIEVRADLPIPAWLFAWGAGVVLIISFAALSTLWKEPRLEEPHGRAVARLPVAVDVVLGAVGVALWAAMVYAGLAGSQVSDENLAPTMVYVVFWVGLVPVSLLFGDVFRLLSPWRSIARGARWVAERATAGELPAPLEYPRRVGRWPAAIGLLVFAWFELAAADGADPRLLSVLAIVYMAAMLVGMSIYGIEPWSRHADTFGVYFNIYARLSPWERRESRLTLRRLGTGLIGFTGVAGTTALLCFAIGTTTFDGFSSSPLWADIQSSAVKAFQHLGLAYTQSNELTYTLGILAGVGFITGIYRIGVWGMRRRVPGARLRPGDSLAARFAGSLAPIAAAYVVAHYFSLLVFQGQATARLASDPLGNGSNLFGTASASIDYGLLTATQIWYVQVAALVCGHAAGLAIAHDRALSVYRSVRAATRSQLWMLLVMVAFTMLALWLLSMANA